MAGIAAVYAAALVACACAGIGVWLLVDTRASQGRIVARSAARSRMGTDAADVGGGLVVRAHTRAAASFERSRPGRSVASRVSAAGLDRSPLDVCLAAAGISVVAFALVQAFLGVIAGLLVAVGVVFGVQAWLESCRRKRAEAFVGQLPELATLLANAARAGLSLRAGIEHAATELSDPAASELRRTSELMRLGQPVDDALEELEQRLPSRELGVLVSTLAIQRSVGGRLASSLSEMTQVLEDRQELRRELATVTSQAVYTGYVAAALGVGSLLLTNVIAPGVLDTMFASWPGRLALAGAGTLYAVGIVLIRKTVKVDI